MGKKKGIGDKPNASQKVRSKVSAEGRKKKRKEWKKRQIA